MGTKVAAVFFTFLFIMNPHASAVPIINVGTHFLTENQAGQQIPIFVTGGDAVQGLNLHVWIEDGFPDFSATGNGPNITGVDILDGTIFSGNNTGQTNVGTFEQLWVTQTTTASGTVAANGLLATITLDTTGFTGGQYRLGLSHPSADATDFAGVQAELVPGRIVIGIPEPIAALLIVSGLVLATVTRNSVDRSRRERGAANQRIHAV